MFIRCVSDLHMTRTVQYVLVFVPRWHTRLHAVHARVRTDAVNTILIVYVLLSDVAHTVCTCHRYTCMPRVGRVDALVTYCVRTHRVDTRTHGLYYTS